MTALFKRLEISALVRDIQVCKMNRPDFGQFLKIGKLFFFQVLRVL
jgi:hypothetical protein